MRALQIKLWRNLWTLKGQGAAIAAVIAIGVAMFVMSFTTVDALRLSQASVYQNQRFAHVFVSLKRAPEFVAERLLELSGVATLETRVQAPVNIQMEDFDQPITGLVLSIPDGQQPQLNRLFLRSGQLPDAQRSDQTLVSEAFADAHGLEPGDRLSVVINGRFQQLLISGVALSPEFIYQVRPGDIMPDFTRYGILWMNRSAVEAAFNMDGAFNSVALTLAPGHSAASVIVGLDHTLAPWGGLGAYSRDDQLSHRYLEDELSSLETMALVLPSIFIGVAAFLLNVVAGRLIRTQREQIAVLKAFGYRALSIAGHYSSLVLAVVLLGSVLGVILGAWIASALAGIYQDFFRFPWLEFSVRPTVVVMAVAIAGSATLLGTLNAVYRAFSLPPAEAMRPEPPASFRRTLVERLGLTWLSQPSRIILRNLERQPVKASMSVLGISLAVALVMLTGFIQGSVAYMLDVQFRLAQKQDLTITFSEPAGHRTVYELGALPGVRYAEGFRHVPAILRYGHREYRGALQGYAPDSQLFTVLDADLQPVQIPGEGVLLTEHLGRMLAIRPGDSLQVSVQEGRRPELSIPVAGLVTEFIGVGAYMHRDTLTRLLREDDAISGALVAVEPQQQSQLNRRLERIPRIAGVNFRENVIAAFNETMDETVVMFTLFSMVMAGFIAFAVVYNNARIALAERGRELASLRVLGFTRAEVTFILLGELLLLTVIALPVGFGLGIGFAWLLTWGMQTDLYRIPLVMHPRTYAMGALVVLVATLLSSLIIGRSLAKQDMVSALKATG